VIRSACEAAEESEIAYRGSIRTGLISCFGRDISWEMNKLLAEKIAYWSKEKVKLVGVDLAGPESVRPMTSDSDLKKLEELYDIAAGDKLGRTVHVGETSHTTVESFLGTLQACK